MNTTVANGLSALAIAILSGVLGGMLGGVVGEACVRWYRISHFEGGSGYAVLGMILAGAVLGFLVGLGAAFLGPSGLPFWKSLGIALGCVIGVGVLVAGIARLAADVAPQVKGQPLEVMIEIRLPKGFPEPAGLKPNQYGPYVNILLDRGRYQPHGKIEVNRASNVLGRWIVPAVTPLRTSVSQKNLRAQLNDDWDAIFPFPLNSVSSKDFEWSGWVAGFFAGKKGWDMTAPLPPVDERVEMRYRLRLVEPETPGPTADELKRAADEEQQRKFEAVSADAPIREWLPYTRHGIPEAQQKAALARLSRADAAAEYASLVLSTNREEAREVLALLPRLERAPEGMSETMTRYGRELAERFAAVNATTAESDPSYQWAAEIALDYYPWINGLREMRSKGASVELCIPELTRILELSRIREDSQVIQSDVRRISSFYLHEWAGVAPHPKDPKPR